MPLKVTDELRKALPEPDAKGIVRANVALRIEGDKAEVFEINDVPVDYVKEDDANETDDANPMPPEDLPDLSKADISG